MHHISPRLDRLLRRAGARIRQDQGQTLVEYAVLAALIAVASILFLSAIGLDIAEIFDKVENAFGIGSPNTVGPGGVSDVAPKTGVVP